MAEEVEIKVTPTERKAAQDILKLNRLLKREPDPAAMVIAGARRADIMAVLDRQPKRDISYRPPVNQIKPRLKGPRDGLEHEL